jgi:hypothetical protein
VFVVGEILFAELSAFFLIDFIDPERDVEKETKVQCGDKKNETMSSKERKEKRYWKP